MPDVNTEASIGTRLSSPSPPPPLQHESIKSTAQKKSTQPPPVITTTLSELPKRKSGLTRSSTDTQISSLQQSKTVSTSPFSVLLPLSPKSSDSLKNPNNIILEEERLNEVDANNNEIKNNTTENKHRYSVDFLLLRSDMPNSKKLPSNWKELNEIFPSICFCGKVSKNKQKTIQFFSVSKLKFNQKVLSYFNPYKYHEHWEKTKNQNYELHNSSCEPQRYPKAQTDDYLNLQTTLRDFHNVNYSNKSYRHNFDSPSHKKHQLPFEMRQSYFHQNQAFYQQENQIKRKHRINNTNSKA